VALALTLSPRPAERPVVKCSIPTVGPKVGFAASEATRKWSRAPSSDTWVNPSASPWTLASSSSRRRDPVAP